MKCTLAQFATCVYMPQRFAVAVLLCRRRRHLFKSFRYIWEILKGKWQVAVGVAVAVAY